MKKIISVIGITAIISAAFVLCGGKKVKLHPMLKKYTQKVPIVFHDKYDISFAGLENLHPFDTKKYGKIAKYLQKTFNITPQSYHMPDKISEDELRLVHTFSYLDSLKSSKTIATIAEMVPFYLIPNFILRKAVLNPMRYATAGTILAAQLAMDNGWAINLSGGYHHAKADSGSGFCFYGDIPLAIKKLRDKNSALKVLVIDLDAHQGNGLEAMLGTDPLTFIFDMYGGNNYPRDTEVFKYIDFNYPQADWVADKEYLLCLKNNLPQAIANVKPDLIIYNAGTDVFEKDPLGKMKITKAGIIERDSFVFDQAFKTRTPIMMVLSGGYSEESAGIIGESIEAIIKKHSLL